MDNMKKKYRKILIIALSVNIMGIFGVCYFQIHSNIPEYLQLVVNRQESFNFSLPVEGNMNTEDIQVINGSSKKINKQSINFSFQKPFTISSSKKGSYTVNLKLFGFISFKQMKIDVIEEKEVIPCGKTIGIQIKTEGILVLGTGTITGSDGMNYEPALNILKSGDYITGVNGEKITTKEEMMEKIQECKGESIVFKVKREQETLKLSINPVKTSDGEYKIGVWIRDDTQGIGTLTYIDKENNFGALGHGITDIDTGLLMSVRKGEIYEASILQIVKGRKGEPGEIVGYINKNEDSKWGNIEYNTKQGIMGEITKEDIIETDKAIPIGLKQEIKTGKATILCQIDDNVEEYEIEIEKVELSSKQDNKGMVIRITDPKLLSKTNGIIQGMSGSPIIQNNKLVGAVTHVFVQDSMKGYGTFIENMIKVEKK